MISSFHESLLRARLCEHELFSVRSIAFISTVVKSTNETWNKYKALVYLENDIFYISDSVRSVVCRRSGSSAIDLEKVYTETPFYLFILEKCRTCVLKVEAIFETSNFSKKKPNSCRSPWFEPGNSVLTAGRPANSAIVIQCWLTHIRNVCVSLHVLFSILDGSSAPVTCSCVPTKRVSQGLEHARNPYSESELVVFRIHANQKKFRIFCQQWWWWLLLLLWEVV